MKTSYELEQEVKQELYKDIVKNYYTALVTQQIYAKEYDEDLRIDTDALRFELKDLKTYQKDLTDEKDEKILAKAKELAIKISEISGRIDYAEGLKTKVKNVDETLRENRIAMDLAVKTLIE